MLLIHSHSRWTKKKAHTFLLISAIWSTKRRRISVWSTLNQFAFHNFLSYAAQSPYSRFLNWHRLQHQGEAPRYLFGLQTQHTLVEWFPPTNDKDLRMKHHLGNSLGYHSVIIGTAQVRYFWTKQPNEDLFVRRHLVPRRWCNIDVQRTLISNPLSIYSITPSRLPILHRLWKELSTLEYDSEEWSGYSSIVLSMVVTKRMELQISYSVELFYSKRSNSGGISNEDIHGTSGKRNAKIFTCNEWIPTPQFQSLRSRTAFPLVNVIVLFSLGLILIIVSCKRLLLFPPSLPVVSYLV